MVSAACQQCGKRLSGSDVRYVSAHKYLCTECFDGQRGVIRGEKGLSERKECYDASPIKKRTLVCGKCDFVNRFREDSPNKMCGYCGSKDLREERTSAASLIAEADSVDTE